MNSLVVLLLVAVSTASASLLGTAALIGPAGPAAALKGPSAQATIVGPDGSSIAAAADAGALAAAPAAGGVVTAAVAPGAVVAAAPAVVAPALLAGRVGTVIEGPSGIITTNGNPYGLIGAAPLVAPAAAAAVVTHGGVAYAAPVAAGLGLGHGPLGIHGLWGR